MVLDILEIAEHDYNWDALEDWRGAEITDGKYNRLAAGNDYLPKSFACIAGENSPGWHMAEEGHCWTAAKQATLSIVINPGETRFRVKIGSLLPNTDAEIWLDKTLLGVVRPPGLDMQEYEFLIPMGFNGPALLSFRVPHLYQPAEIISGSLDERFLGLAVYGVTIDL
jgi:hypothetical protein